MRIGILLFIFVSCLYTVSGVCVHPKKKLALIAGTALLKPKLIGAGLIGGKLIKKKLLLGAGALIGAKILKHKLGCKCSACCRKPFLLRRRRSIADMAADMSNRVFDSFSNRLESASKSVRSVGDQVHRGSDLIRNASLTTRIAGIFATDRVRNGIRNLLGSSSSEEDSSMNEEENLTRRRRSVQVDDQSADESLVRVRRAAPRTRPANLNMPSTGRMSLDEMLSFVRNHNAEICLQRVICELSANSNMYGSEGIRFGTKLLQYERASNAEAAKYKRASRVGNQYRGRPEYCSRKYPKSQCSYESTQLIQVGNTMLN